MKKGLFFREACFVCTSPYQLLNSIAIIQNHKMDADLYIFSTFPCFKEVAEKIQKYSLFTNVYAVDIAKIGFRGKWLKLKGTFFVNTYLNRFLDKNICYRKFYFSCRSTFKSAMLRTLLSRNPEMRLIVFEDGMGTYSDRHSSLAVTNARRLYEKILRLDLINPARTTFMAHFPHLVHYTSPYDVCTIEELPRLDQSPENRYMLCDLFSVPEDDTIHERCIIFDPKRSGPTLLSAEQTAIMEHCYQIVINNLGNDNVILKPHPRSVEACAVDIRSYTHQEIPMEVLYADMSDLKDRILVSFVSTAIFTPRMLFDVEPIIISLHRIVRDNKTSRNFEGIFEKFREVYHNAERVYAPETIEELDGLMKQLVQL